MLEAALLFWMLWLPWTQLTWAANAVSAHSRNVQAIFLVATVTSVPMAAAVSTALDGAGFLFAGSVSIILAMGLVMLIMGHETGSAEWKSSITYAIPNAAAMILFLAGAAFDDTPVRVGFWIAGIGIIAFGTLLAAEGDWVVRVGHFAERHGLILIIALGEIIVAIAVPVLDALTEDQGLPKESVISLVLAGTFAGLLWWGYFDRPQKVFESRFETLEGSDRARYARDVYTYLHSLIVSGVIVSAAALEEITLHPLDDLHLEFRIMLLIGLGMFFAGIELSALRAFHVVPIERAVAMAVLAALLLFGGSVDGLWLLGAIDLVILAALILEARLLEHHTDTARTD